VTSNRPPPWKSLRNVRVGSRMAVRYTPGSNNGWMNDQDLYNCQLIHPTQRGTLPDAGVIRSALFSSPRREGQNPGCDLTAK